jgi:hypothetical protein
MSGDFDWPQLIWLLMALLLVSGAGFGFQRLRHSPRAALLGVVFWAALIVAIVFAYNAFN